MLHLNNPLIRYTFLVALFCGFATLANGRNTVSPLDYGLREAHNGEETYYVLLKCHQDAVKKNSGVCYAGIKELVLEIPSNAKSIPLTYFTDFAGVRLKVKNTYKNLALFSISQKLIPIDTIKGIDIDRGNLSGYPELSKGKKLLVIEDEKPWVDNRRGYSYGAIRRDVMLVTNGRASNRPVMSYGSPASKPRAEYCEVNKGRFVIKNLLFIRDATSSKMTMLVDLSNLYNVEITNILIETPNNDELYRDAAIKISNCVNVALNDITINGTYSLFNHSGYGVNLNNIYNLKVNRMYARAKWGVFGCNNINTVTLNNCDINRFDIHCYGRDVKSFNCKYSDLYNQFSSVYGTVSFKKCTFTDFTPVLMEPSYNAYSPFDIEFKNCIFNLTKRHNYIITFSGLTDVENSRPELRRKCMPNIVMKNCRVNIDNDVKTWYLVRTGKVDYKGRLDYVSEITIKKVKVSGKAEFELSTKEFVTTNTPSINIDIENE